jgi:hypothetical protein
VVADPSDIDLQKSQTDIAMMGISNDHYAKLMVGFGYPEIPYARGVQKDRSAKIHRYSQDKYKRKK